MGSQAGGFGDLKPPRKGGPCDLDAKSDVPEDEDASAQDLFFDDPADGEGVPPEAPVPAGARPPAGDGAEWPPDVLAVYPDDYDFGGWDPFIRG